VRGRWKWCGIGGFREATLSAFINGMISISIAAICALAPSQSSAATPLSQDEIAIYETILASWSGENSGHQLVDYRLDTPPEASDPELRQCTKGLRFPQKAQQVKSQKSLVGVEFKGETIALTDGSKWEPNDPELAIAKGKSVAKAVSEGFSHSLISFSEVTFSVDGRDALVEFSMVCGMLCGSGSTIHMHKAGLQWHEVNRCRSRVS